MPRFFPFLILTIWALAIFTAGIWGRAGPVDAASHNPASWHPPGFGHEHGDPPPEWLTKVYQDHPEWAPYFGKGVLYDGPHNTSDGENTIKHFAMKGVRLTHPAFKDRDGKWLDGYMVMHLSGTPLDREVTHHSVRVWIADAGGGLTIRQGWIDTGDTDSARVPKRCALNTGGPDCGKYDAYQRPIVLGVDKATFDGTYTGRPDGFETWYANGAGFSFGWGLNTPTLMAPGEKASDADPHKWHATGAKGQVRLIDVTAGKPSVRGAFFATPRGTPCSGPGNGCLLQYISPTYQGIKGSVQRTWPVSSDWELPN